MSLLDKKIAELKLSKEIAGIYRDELSDESLTGIVVDFNKEFLVLNLLTDEGEDDGISVFYRHSITRIRTGGNARDSVKALSVFRSTKIKAPKLELTSIKGILTSIQSVYGYVNVHTEFLDEDYCFIGKLIEQDHEWVSLLAFGTKSNRDTNSLLLSKEEITRVDAGAKYEESIKYLALEKCK